MIDTKKKCVKMFDGAALHTIQKMSTPDMEELMEIVPNVEANWAFIVVF